MLRDFRNFLTKDNFVALAIAVVLGAAVGKLVQAIVDDFIMPIVGAVTPLSQAECHHCKGERDKREKCFCAAIVVKSPFSGRIVEAFIAD